MPRQFEPSGNGLARDSRSDGRAARTLTAIALMALLAGCGQDSEPKISDASQHLIEARKAIVDGSAPKALEALNASIESEPNVWAYLERAKIHARQGADEEARKDCKAILELAPENRDVAWIEGELKKPVEQRFKGRFASPPSYSR